MDSKYFGLNDKISRLVKVPADQGRIVAIAMAMAAAAQARLPTSPVENISAFYAEQVYPVAAEKLSEINESVVFASKSALALSETFWKLRYHAAFPAQYVDQVANSLETLLRAKAKQQMDLTSLWAGGATHISDELSAFMNLYTIEISVIAAHVCKLMTPPNSNYDRQDSALAG